MPGWSVGQGVIHKDRYRLRNPLLVAEAVVAAIFGYRQRKRHIFILRFVDVFLIDECKQTGKIDRREMKTERGVFCFGEIEKVLDQPFHS